jgi:hypothetical protein
MRQSSPPSFLLILNAERKSQRRRVSGLGLDARTQITATTVCYRASAVASLGPDYEGVTLGWASSPMRSCNAA